MSVPMRSPRSPDSAPISPEPARISPESARISPEPARISRSVDLKRQYKRIGIPAVAAAARYQAQPAKNEPKPAAPDRSTARGWSRHS